MSLLEIHEINGIMHVFLTINRITYYYATDNIIEKCLLHNLQANNIDVFEINLYKKYAVLLIYSKHYGGLRFNFYVRSCDMLIKKLRLKKTKKGLLVSITKNKIQYKRFINENIELYFKLFTDAKNGSLKTFSIMDNNNSQTITFYFESKLFEVILNKSTTCCGFLSNFFNCC
jgi:hypothetical protein